MIQSKVFIITLLSFCFDNINRYCASSLTHPQSIKHHHDILFRTSSSSSSSSSLSSFAPIDRRSIFRVAGIALSSSFISTRSQIAKGVTDGNVEENTFPIFESSSSSSSSSVSLKPLADVPLKRLRLPKGSFGREYVIVQLKINDKGPLFFMVDTGLSIEMMSPHLVESLGLSSKSGSTKLLEGLSAGGRSSESVLELSGASLCCGKFNTDNDDDDELVLPMLHAVVTDFPQEHIDPIIDPVEGMLGMELLDMFDVDFDFPKGRLRLWKPGTASMVAKKDKMIAISDGVINDTGLLGLRLSSTNNKNNGNDDISSESPPNKQPVLGIIDTGASFSTVNWAATPYLGIPSKENVEAYQNSPKILGLGIDMKPINLSTTNLSFTFVGESYRDSNSGQLLFQNPPSNWKPWNEVTVAVGDLPVFSQLLGNGVKSYNGPAVLLGLDILSQRRIILETGRGRKRNLYISPN